jgi:hypothetical protein
LYTGGAAPPKIAADLHMKLHMEKPRRPMGHPPTLIESATKKCC